MIPVMIPVTQFRSRKRGKLHLRESNFTNFPGGGGMPPDLPPSQEFVVPDNVAARTVHVRQLNHCIRYFQMLPKTLVG